MATSTTLTLTVLKIGKKSYEIKKGDYVLYNGICYQFIAGDKRALKGIGYNSETSLMLSKSAVKQILFDQMKKVERGNLTDRNLCIKWYF